MKLQRLLSGNETYAGARVSAHTLRSPRFTASLSPQASAGCIQTCVGVSAAAACAHCGNDSSCWDDCAGAGKGACVSRCF